MIQSIQNEIYNLLTYIILGLLGTLLTYGIKFLKDKGILSKYQSNKQIINDSVAYVEQVFKDLHGQEKFNAAKDRALKILTSKGIKITDEEVSTLIEQCVKTMNDSIKTALK